jgi:hypothetical protein
MEKTNKETKAAASEQPENQMEKMQKILSAQIDKFQHLNRLIEHRGLFLNKREKLAAGLAELKKEASQERFDTENFSVSFQIGRYRSDDALKISNPFLIEEIGAFVIAKIDNKVKELELEIIGNK